MEKLKVKTSDQWAELNLYITGLKCFGIITEREFDKLVERLRNNYYSNMED